MIVTAIDPGHKESAMVMYDPTNPLGPVRVHGMWTNTELLELLKAPTIEGVLAIERIQGMGMAVGEEVFETVRWEARFAMAWGERPYLLVPRRQVKQHHCNSDRAKDPHIRQAMLDRFGPGKDAAIGKKATPGPLFGISGDEWSALAIATATYDNCKLHNWNLEEVRSVWLKRAAQERGKAK